MSDSRKRNGVEKREINKWANGIKPGMKLDGATTLGFFIIGIFE